MDVFICPSSTRHSSNSKHLRTHMSQSLFGITFDFRTDGVWDFGFRCCASFCGTGREKCESEHFCIFLVSAFTVRPYAGWCDVVDMRSNSKNNIRAKLNTTAAGTAVLIPPRVMLIRKGLLQNCKWQTDWVNNTWIMMLNNNDADEWITFVWNKYHTRRCLMNWALAGFYN